MIDPSLRLRRAILLNDVPLVKRIIRSNPTFLQNPNFEDKSNTSLHLAAQEGFEDIVALLLDSGHEDGEISRNADWDTPLMLAARLGRIEVGKLLIDRCSRCIPWTNKQGLDALSISCQNQISTPLITLLLSHPEHPASPHGRDNGGDTPLHHASASGSLKALRILLSAGADPMAKNAFDWSPLAYSQTVAAEVYFKNLVAEFERRKAEGVRGEKERQEEQARRRGAGVRLVTEDGNGEQRAMRPGGELQRSETTDWSLAEKRKAFTPILNKSNTWTGIAEGNRARAQSGD